MTDAVQTRYRVTGMNSGSCAVKVDAAVRRLPGVKDVSVSASAGTMTVRHQQGETLLPAMRASLAGLGYNVRPANPATSEGDSRSHLDEDNRSEGPLWRSRKGLLTIACGLALAAAYGIGKLAPQRNVGRSWRPWRSASCRSRAGPSWPREPERRSPSRC